MLILNHNLTFQTPFKGRITKIDYNQLESGDRTGSSPYLCWFALPIGKCHYSGQATVCIRISVPELSSSFLIFNLTRSSHCLKICTASSIEQLSSRMLSMANSLSPGSKVPVLRGKEKKMKSTFVFAFQIPRCIQSCSGDDNINFSLSLIFPGKQP